MAAILAMILAMGIPAMSKLTADGRLGESVNLLISNMRTARSEAIARFDTNIVVCASDSGRACSGDWSKGWMVFVDTNRSGAHDGNEEILRVVSLPEQELSLSVAGLANARIIFSSDGMSQPASLVLCDDRGAEYAKAVVLNGSGQARMAGDDDKNGKVNLHDKTDATCG